MRSITRDVVTLTLMTESGAPIANLSFSRSEYAERKATIRPLADAAYRRARGVRFVRARFYESGHVVEERVHGYDARGAPIGSMSLSLDGLVLRTIPEAKRAMGKLIRRHQDAPPSFRRALVALTKKELAKGRSVVAVARDLEMPAPTLTRWVAALTPKGKKKSTREASPHRDGRRRETCPMCLAMERGLF